METTPSEPTRQDWCILGLVLMFGVPFVVLVFGSLILTFFGEIGLAGGQEDLVITVVEDAGYKDATVTATIREWGFIDSDNKCTHTVSSLRRLPRRAS